MRRPDLIVRTGETHRLSARKYTYSNILVEDGARLVVPPRSRNFLALEVIGDVIVKGWIEYRGCIATAGGKTVSFSDGTAATYEHPRSAFGGFGGDGGIMGRTDIVNPGRGAPGTVDYGGGGGGGGLHNRRTQASGENAKGFRSGKRIFAGADGARANAARHGGMIALYVPNGSLDGSLGTIDLRGFDGKEGGNATTGYGGGGGGAPGGDGGYLFIKARTILSEPQTLFDPGSGGTAGSGGSARNAFDGTAGDDGEFGFADIL